jgi:uncharacterized protein YjbJ (UPF0337 family)
MFIVKHDAVKFLINKGKREEARAHIKKIYKEAKDEQFIDRYYEALSST